MISMNRSRFSRFSCTKKSQFSKIFSKSAYLDAKVQLNVDLLIFMVFRPGFLFEDFYAEN